MNAFSDLLQFLLAAADRGERTALVTITDVIGSSPRAPGTHMGVTERGAYFGSVSGGCVEAAVATEAVRIMKTGRAEEIRFGRGSPFLDIRLPCGGGIDLLFTPMPASEVLAEALRQHEARRPVLLALGRHGSLDLMDSDGGGSGWNHDVFYAFHRPRLKLCVFGRGAEGRSLLELAPGLGVDLCVVSPEEELIAAAQAMGAEAHHLASREAPARLSIDRNTAIVMLFHDHGWELDILQQLLPQPALFIGAMGSRRTHEDRLEELRKRGVKEAMLAKLVGPIGLIPSTRDPRTLALSVLAQVVERYNAAEPSNSARACQARAIA
ncbi:XdhC and CoxI family protein [Methyloligella halotolerans]|uniref:XdhC and CoxI family protein n=1 Tax=Methyloligella halotolerans TaxID=1177755 RepID=A0A1E2RXH7_9HYPH|nr:XdhC family protein [Methyloligella halotolerans]ODA66759.1 XdhC and CoxI family protein [Methyloligella halotolerans]